MEKKACGVDLSAMADDNLETLHLQCPNFAAKFKQPIPDAAHSGCHDFKVLDVRSRVLALVMHPPQDENQPPPKAVHPGDILWRITPYGDLSDGPIALAYNSLQHQLSFDTGLPRELYLLWQKLCCMRDEFIQCSTNALSGDAVQAFASLPVPVAAFARWMSICGKEVKEISENTPDIELFDAIAACQSAHDGLENLDFEFTGEGMDILQGSCCVPPEGTNLETDSATDIVKSYYRSISRSISYDFSECQAVYSEDEIVVEEKEKDGLEKANSQGGDKFDSTNDYLSFEDEKNDKEGRQSSERADDSSIPFPPSNSTSEEDSDSIGHVDDTIPFPPSNVESQGEEETIEPFEDTIPFPPSNDEAQDDEEDASELADDDNNNDDDDDDSIPFPASNEESREEVSMEPVDGSVPFPPSKSTSREDSLFLTDDLENISS